MLRNIDEGRTRSRDRLRHLVVARFQRSPLTYAQELQLWLAVIVIVVVGLTRGELIRVRWTKVAAYMLGLTLALSGASPALAEGDATEATPQVEVDESAVQSKWATNTADPESVVASDDAELEAQATPVDKSAVIIRDIKVGDTIVDAITEKDAYDGVSHFCRYAFDESTNTSVDVQIKVTK